MRGHRRANLTARVFLTIGALLPYWRLLTFGVVYVPDDTFTSDIFNGELPGRVLVGQLIRHGQLPVWTNQLCSGLPLAGAPADPVGLAAFTLLPPAAALDLLVIVLLLVAAHGTYGLARRFGANRPGAILAGLAFAGSGYIASQLRHLGIISTIAWLPVGLLLIDHVLASADPTRATSGQRAFSMALFGLVFAEQVLSGFPQSAYICALAYGSFALFRAFADRRQPEPLRTRLSCLGGLGVAAILGAAAGAVVLLPLSELGSVSDRAESLGYAWATRIAYWPPNVLTFVVPYLFGDISNNTYAGPPVFWEDYGYVGLVTVLLACYGPLRKRVPPTIAFTILMTIVAFLLVLGPATPVFRIVYELVPGMKLFRFPTRFLIVVELGLALLGAYGLTQLCAQLDENPKVPRWVPRSVAVAVCALLALDLWFHQPRQNPMVSGRQWLAAPASSEMVRADSLQPRTFTPRRFELHMRAFDLAHGWANVEPYFELRDALEPNTGGAYWNTPSADCYAGIAPSWYVDVWGDPNRPGLLVRQLTALDADQQVLRVRPELANVLRTYGVSHLLSRFPQEGAPLTLVGHAGNAYVYRVDGAARVRVVSAARYVKTDQEVVAGLLDRGFDPEREILLEDAPDSERPAVDERRGSQSSTAPNQAVVTSEDSQEIVIQAEASADGYLLLADTFYPGWTARVDGVPTAIYRANLSVRGIQLPKGRHEVRFRYDAPGFARGLQITLLALSTLMIWLGAAAVGRARHGRASREICH
jgi:hypothetical protein